MKILKRIPKCHSQAIKVDLLFSNWDILKKMQEIVMAKTGEVPSCDVLINCIVSSIQLDVFEKSL